MKLIRIYNANAGVPDFDLRNILKALGPHVRGYSWTVTGVATYNEALDATGEKAGRLAKLAVSGRRIHGGELQDLADGIRQVIWGEFHAYEDLITDVPAIIVRAVDSSFYEGEQPCHCGSGTGDLSPSTEAQSRARPAAAPSGRSA